jgi:spoIIIJ-associated protein
MKKEVIVTAKTVAQAVEDGARQLGMSANDVSHEVIEHPKKGFLGIGSSEAKVKVVGEISKKDTALAFIEKITGHFKINAMPKVTGETKDEIKIDIIGENLGLLIGYHGEILDSLQYLTYLAVNKDADGDDPDYDKSGIVKISIDIENYRKKREETLQSLARKMADRVTKYGRSVTLEPMNAYERRIIHSAIQNIEGVSTHSVGQENERRIVITSGSRPPVSPGYSQRRTGYGGRHAPDKGKEREKNFRK